MKIGAAILLVIIGFFTIQPAFPVQQEKTKMGCCLKERCKKKMPVQKKKSCEGMACNPFLGCPYFNLFLAVNTYSPVLPVADKQKLFVRNDNRTIQSSSELWHPPNAC